MTLSAGRVLLVVGTRPEVIKMAPVLSALRTNYPDLETSVAFTGQHTTLVDSVLGAFEIEPDFDLALMREDQSLYDVLGDATRGLGAILRDLQPHMLLAQGDTATVFAASLAGFLERVPVGHVEAGLRSGDKSAPWPEEVFRRLTDVISDHYFAPTTRARDLLLAENVPAEQVHVTGNTVVDALLDVAGRGAPVTSPDLRRALDGTGSRGRLVLVTAHRRESFGAPLRRVFDAIRRIVDEHPDVQVLYPVHPNPNVRRPAHEALGDTPGVCLTEPLDYVDTVTAMRAAELILTDSGGIQEEAPTFGTPVLVLREVTERPEGIDAGVAELVGTDTDRIVEAARRVLATGRTPSHANPYGDGRAGERIADIVHSVLTQAPRTTTDWTGSTADSA